MHKGDLLTVIDPTDYKIGVSFAEAAVEQAKATAENAAAESRRRQALTDLAATSEEKQAYAANALAAQPPIGTSRVSLFEYISMMCRRMCARTLARQSSGS